MSEFKITPAANPRLLLRAGIAPEWAIKRQQEELKLREIRRAQGLEPPIDAQPESTQRLMAMTDAEREAYWASPLPESAVVNPGADLSTPEGRDAYVGLTEETKGRAAEFAEIRAKASAERNRKGELAAPTMEYGRSEATRASLIPAELKQRMESTWLCTPGIPEDQLTPEDLARIRPNAPRRDDGKIDARTALDSIEAKEATKRLDASQECSKDQRPKAPRWAWFLWRAGFSNVTRIMKGYRFEVDDYER